VPLETASLRSSDSNYSGANDIALAIADVANQKLAGIDSLTLSEYAARTVSSLGQEISGVQDRLAVQSTVVDLLNTQRSEVSGVSMDEEVSNMVQYQQAYQASSRYFNVLSEMMDTLINSLG
jgi:flagellar hook-associated protein 1 FlgK